MNVKERLADYYVTKDGKRPFQLWRASFLDKKAISAIDGRIRRMRSGNFGDSKPVGEGVCEMRIFFGPGLRIYYGIHDDTIVLLHGGDKGSQENDISVAKEYWKDHRQKASKCQTH